MSSIKKLPPRIHVLLARESPVGLIIRRGPSKLVCALGWDRVSDSFVLGQWMRGRIYERRCDLSPDGKRWIYLAMNGKWDSETQGAYTAIAQAPYLKAVGLWAKGNCWDGGGLFLDNSTYWLNDRYEPTLITHPTGLVRVAHYDGEYSYGAEDLGVYYLRLLRDGWILVERRGLDQWDSLDIFEKPVGSGWTLRKLAHATLRSQPGRGCYYDEHELERSGTGEKHCFTSWEWAEVDRQRLVWAECGKLFAGEVAAEGIVNRRELYDFNGMTFRPITAPY